MEFLQDLYHEGDEIDIPLIEALNESILAATKGGKVDSVVQGAKDFFVKHPALTILAATMAVDAYAKYKSNSRNTIRLFAKDAYEKQMMTDVVNALTQHGRFKLKKTAYADGGKVWVLKRVGV